MGLICSAPPVPNASEEDSRIIHSHVAWAVGAGLVPVPLLDMIAVAYIQLDMLKQLATAHRVSYRESDGKVFVAALTGTAGAQLAANAIKLIPGVGSVLGGVSMSIMSGASTYALGHVAAHHFSHSGTLDSIDMASAKRAYEEALEKGKEVAKRAASKENESRDVFERLEKAKEARDKGIISDDDFDAIKARLLEEV